MLPIIIQGIFVYWDLFDYYEGITNHISIFYLLIGIKRLCEDK